MSEEIMNIGSEEPNMHKTERIYTLFKNVGHFILSYKNIINTELIFTTYAK